MQNQPVSAPSTVNLEKQFIELSVKKDLDPEVWITELEDLCVKLKNMGSCITENQFMIHMLNNLTSDYDDVWVWFSGACGHCFKSD
jgi:hypothetical protein